MTICAAPQTSRHTKGGPMSELQLYRKRLIPDECILLKDDIIVKQTEELVITSWLSLIHI